MKKIINLPIHPNALLSDYTTFQLGGSCRGLVSCARPEELCTVINTLHQEKSPFILIGGGSNLVVSDEGVPCYVIRFFSERPLIEKSGTNLIVSGSTLLDDLAQFAVENGLKGVTYASGIPGTVGGAITGNAGAFGKQIGDVLTKVLLLTSTGEKKEVYPGALGFSYRNSILKKSGDIVLSAHFSLSSASKEYLLNMRKDILALRYSKHPDLQAQPCAGSFFRNIEPSSNVDKRQAAWWFLEETGAKDFQCGGASLFDKHANIIVKSNGCSAQDVYDLSRRMAQAVHDKFHFDLVREVRFVGKFQGMPDGIETFIW